MSLLFKVIHIIVQTGRNMKTKPIFGIISFYLKYSKYNSNSLCKGILVSTSKQFKVFSITYLLQLLTVRYRNQNIPLLIAYRHPFSNISSMKPSIAVNCFCCFLRVFQITFEYIWPFNTHL